MVFGFHPTLTTLAVANNTAAPINAAALNQIRPV